VDPLSILGDVLQYTNGQRKTDAGGKKANEKGPKTTRGQSTKPPRDSRNSSRMRPMALKAEAGMGPQPVLHRDTVAPASAPPQISPNTSPESALG
jgi:hypothetical protein